MKTLKTLALEAIASRKAGAPGHRPDFEIRYDLVAALEAEQPAAFAAMKEALAAGRGKKAVVAAVCRVLLDLDEPAVQDALNALVCVDSWRNARGALADLGLAGEILAAPQCYGVTLPCAPCACPGSWGTNWGLPNVSAVAEILLRGVTPWRHWMSEDIRGPGQRQKMAV